MISLFKFVRGLRRRREVRRMTQAVTSHPTPRNYEALCERLVASKGPAAAAEVANEARRLFPWSERLQAVARQIKRAAERDELVALEKAIERSPTPEGYGRLAETFRRVGEQEEAIRVCRECAARFPQNENAFLVEGRIRIEKMRRTGLLRDGRLAVEHLERAVDLNPDNLKARRLLAELYRDLAAWGHARSHLEYMAQLGVTDEETERMLEEVRSAVNDTAEADSEDIEGLLRKARDRGALRAVEFAETDCMPAFAELVETLRNDPSVEDVVHISGDVVSSGESAGEAGSELSEVSNSFVGLAQGALVEMDMGNYRYSELTGRLGGFLLFRFGSESLAIRTRPAADTAVLREAVLSVPAAGSPVQQGAGR